MILDTNKKIHTFVYFGVFCYLELPEDLKKKRDDEATKLSEYIVQLKNQLNNKEFVSHAPKQIVDAKRAKLKEVDDQLSQLIR